MKRHISAHLAVLLMTFAAVNVRAQLQTKDGLTLKPRTGFGIGTLYFRGDVGGDSKGYNMLTADAGFSVTASQEITHYLELELQSIFGKFSINEQNTERRYNFRSSIHSLGLNAVYNFDHFMAANPIVQPWVSLGFGSFEYLSKTDLKDANGNTYHYWSDGSIRSIAETDPNAAQAVLLERDHVYETDLRDLNADGLGKYRDRSWSMPIGAGATMHLSDRFRVKMGTTMHFTFTDLIDNVSTAGEGMRQGSKNKDKFLYTSVGINYDLHFTPKNRPVPLELMDENGEMYIAWLSEDMDGDGVNDFIDLSAGTPPGVKVDKFGVPIDSDGDGFPDYVDFEPMSEDLTTIDFLGESKGDEWVQFRYGAWIDSLRWSTYFGDSYMKRDFKRINGSSGFNSKQRYYDVFLTTDAEPKSQEEIDALLAVKDLRTEVSGTETRYSAGQFDEVTEAVKRKIELETEGIDGRVELTTPAKRIDMTPVANVIAKELKEDAATTGRSTTGLTNSTSETAGSSSANNTAGENATAGSGNNQTNSGKNIAENTQTTNSSTGSAGNLSNAGTGNESSTQPSNTAGIVTGTNASSVTGEEQGVFYRVQLGAFRKPLSEAMFAGIDGVIAIKGSDGLTRYTVGSFDNMQDAAKMKIAMQLAGFEDAFITSYKGKKRIEILPDTAPSASSTENGQSTETAQSNNSAPENKTSAPIKDPETTFANSDKIRFTVLLGTFTSQIPTEMMDKFLETGGVKPNRNAAQGITSFTKGDFASAAEAEGLLQQLKAAGFTNAVISGKFNNQIISAEEAIRLKNPDGK